METLTVTPSIHLSPHNHRQLSSSLSFSTVDFSLNSRFYSRAPSLSTRCPLKCSAVLSSPSIVNNSTEFVEAAQKGNLIPLFKCIFSDHLTPVLAYRCLVSEDDREAPSFLFEAVEPGVVNSHVGRYSIVGAQPSMEIVAKENSVTVMDHQEGKRTEEFVEDPLTVSRKIMEKWEPHLIDELPDVFCAFMGMHYGDGLLGVLCT